MHLTWETKNREKIKKIRVFDLSYFTGKRTSKIMDLKIN